MEIASLMFLFFAFSSWADFLYILDYYMDGQLGVEGDDATVPRLLEHFIGLTSPESLTDESETKSRVPLKVWNTSYCSCMGKSDLNSYLVWLFISGLFCQSWWNDVSCN